MGVAPAGVGGMIPAVAVPAIASIATETANSLITEHLLAGTAKRGERRREAPPVRGY